MKEVKAKPRSIGNYRSEAVLLDHMIETSKSARPSCPFLLSLFSSCLTLMAISQTSSWNLLVPRRKNENVVSQRAKQNVGRKQSQCFLLAILVSTKILSLPIAGMDSTSDGDGPESEEDGVEANPYPLDGKYVDEYDRQRYTATFTHCHLI